MVHLLAEQYDTKSNIKLGEFRSQFQAPCESSPTEKLWYMKQSVFGWQYIYIYIYVCVCVCACVHCFLLKTRSAKAYDVM